MTELGWRKQKVKWGAKDYTRALWVRPGCIVEGGWITDATGRRTSLTLHLQKLEPFLDLKAA